MTELKKEFEETFNFEEFESIRKYFDLIGAMVVVLDLRGEC